jgi:hypothetical protein
MMSRILAVLGSPVLLAATAAPWYGSGDVTASATAGLALITRWYACTVKQALDEMQRTRRGDRGMRAWLLALVGLAPLLSSCGAASVGAAPTPTPIVVASVPEPTRGPNADTVTLTFRLTLFGEVSKRDGFGAGARSTDQFDWQLAPGTGASFCGKHPDARTERQYCEGHGATYTTTVSFPRGTHVQYGLSRWTLCPEWGDNSITFGEGDMTLTEDTTLTETFTYDERGRTCMHYDGVSCDMPGPGTAKQTFRLRLKGAASEGETFGVRVTGMGPGAGLFYIHCGPLGPCGSGQYDVAERYPVGSEIRIEYLRWDNVRPYTTPRPDEGQVFARFVTIVGGKATHAATYLPAR